MIIKNLELENFEIDDAKVAVALAHMNNDEQAEFLRMFAEQLRSLCGSDHGFQLQAMMIANSLDADTRAFLKACSETE